MAARNAGNDEREDETTKCCAAPARLQGGQMNYWLFNAIGFVVALLIVFMLVVIAEHDRW